MAGRGGNSIIEFTLLMPWYFFLFVGAYDFGIYSYALVATQDGVRTAAVNASQSTSTAADSATACQFVLDSIRNLPNIGSAQTTCTSPITVTASLVTGPDGSSATTVTAVYGTPQLVPIPGLLPGSLTITRSATMRLRS